MFRNGVDRPIAPGLDPHKADRVLPSFRLAPALWLRCRLPAWLRRPVAGLDLYQWVGLAVAVAAASAAAWASLRLAERLACRLLRLVRVEVERVVVAPKLRPLAAQFGLWCLYLQLRMLDLPATAVGATIPVLKVLWIGLIGWTGFRLIDLVMVLYARSERLVDRRNLSDMIVPTAANGLKLLTFLAAISGQVYLVGSGETLTRLLAGLGLIGLAASLAAQDTLKNFFGTLLLIGEHPFRIGDYVVDPGAGRGRRERGLPLDPPADAGGLAADDPELGDGVGPDRQPGVPDLPRLPRGRLAGLRHAPGAHGGPARRRPRLRGRAPEGPGRTRRRCTSPRWARVAST